MKTRYIKLNNGNIYRLDNIVKVSRIIQYEFYNKIKYKIMLYYLYDTEVVIYFNNIEYAQKVHDYISVYLECDEI